MSEHIGRLFFKLPTIDNRVDKAIKYEKKLKGIQQAINTYCKNAELIGDAMECDREMDLTCSCLNFAHYTELVANINYEVWLVCNQDEFDNC